jgi:uncharacterized protein YjbI with pentapeptide repeats
MDYQAPTTVYVTQTIINDIWTDPNYPECLLLTGKNYSNSESNQGFSIKNLLIQEVDFSDVNYSNVQFINSSLFNVNFSNSKLKNSSFEEKDGDSSLYKCPLPQMLAAVQFNKANLTKAFFDINMNTVDFTQAKLTKAKIKNVLHNVSFKGAVLSYADLSGIHKRSTSIDFTGANMNGAKLNQHLVDNAELFNITKAQCNLDKVTFTCLSKEDIEKLEIQKRINEAKEKSNSFNYDAQKFSQSKSIVDSENLTNSNFSTQTYLGGIFINKDFSKSYFNKIKFKKNIIKDNITKNTIDIPGKILNSNFTYSNFINTEFDTLLENVNFNNAKLVGAKFAHHLDNVSFKNADLTNADFSKVTWSYLVDFTGADMTGVQLTKEIIYNADIFNIAKAKCKLNKILAKCMP